MVASDALLSVLGLAAPIQLDAQHVERGGRWRGALPKLLHAPGALVSTMGRKVCAAPAELLECRCEAGAVVHNLPAIREDDGEAVGRLGMVAGDLHGSEGGEEISERILLGGADSIDELGEKVQADNLHVVGGIGLRNGATCHERLHPGKSFGKSDSLHGVALRLGWVRAALAEVVALKLKFSFGGIAAGKSASEVERHPEALSVFFNCGAHLVWLVVLAFGAQLRSTYTVLVWQQENFTLFLCSPDSRAFSPPRCPPPPPSI